MVKMVTSHISENGDT